MGENAEDLSLSELVKRCEDSPEEEDAYEPLLRCCRRKFMSDGHCDLRSSLKALADVARTETGRNVLVKSGVVKDVAETPWPEDELVLVQVCRLGGNLCYDHPAGRDCVLEAGLLGHLATKLKEMQGPEVGQVWRMVPSFLHNYCHDNPASLASVTSLVTILASHFSDLASSEENVDTVDNFVSFLSGLQNHEGKHELFTQVPVSKCLTSLLENFEYEAVVTSVLDLLQELFDDEKMCLAYLDNGVLGAIMKRTSGVCVMESGEAVSEDVSSQSLDLVALLSSHAAVVPAIMPLMDTAMVSWLGDPPSPHHLATAALLAGNLATSDAACVQLMATQVPGLLVGRVSAACPGKVLHAVVGCLRNLSVCAAARDQLVQLGLVEASCQLVVALSTGTDHTVTPKLLNTLRLVTQAREEASRELGTNTDLVQSLVKIGQYSLVPGLNIEAARLASSLIRYSHDGGVVSVATEAGVLPLLLGLLNSPHSQLLNEALVAISLVTAPVPPAPEVVESIDADFLAGKVVEILAMEESKCPKEVKFNAVSLVYNILKWNIASVSQVFKDSDLKGKLDAFENELKFINDMRTLLI